MLDLDLRMLERQVLTTSREFVPWVEANEPGILTYALFTRRKAPQEILLFVRYADKKAMQAHNEATEHVTVV
jgi:quinol monooxygenase YgiN